MRVIIIEDRHLAREELKYLLSLQPDIELINAFEDTAQAWPLLESGDVDGVFLDIDIETEGRRAGLDLAIRLDRLALANKPWLVFTTGYEEYALAAHQVRPFGYLLKPLDDGKLVQVLDKVRSTLKPVPMRIEVKHKTVHRDEVIWCTKYLNPEELLSIQSENNVNTTKVQLVSGETLSGVNRALNRWKAEFHLPDFIQIHKCHLVNLQHVNGLKPDPFKDETYKVTFRCSSQELSIGKTYLADLRQALGRRV